MTSVLRNMFREMQLPGIEKEVKSHLTRVYTSMGLALLACAVGSYIHLAGIFTAGILTMIACIGAMLALMLVPPSPDNQGLRFGLLMIVGLLCGIDQGPLLKLVIDIDPSIVMTAFLATSLIFICFSMASLTSRDRKWLALGGILMSALSWLFLFGILNIFLKSTLIFEIWLYVGLAVACGFVLYDTQVIVEKRRNGDDDFIGHSLLMFVDFLDLFRHILILLADKESNDRRRRRRSD